MTDFQISTWYNTYVKNPSDDPHSQFASEMGIGRGEAKQLAYKIAYSVETSEIMEDFSKKH